MICFPEVKLPWMLMLLQAESKINVNLENFLFLTLGFNKQMVQNSHFYKSHSLWFYMYALKKFEPDI